MAAAPPESLSVAPIAVEIPTAPLAAEAGHGPEAPPLPTRKKSLLSAIHAGQEPVKPLLKGEASPGKGSLLSQLARKKKRSDD
jgi:hypothetical protein